MSILPQMQQSTISKRIIQLSGLGLILLTISIILVVTRQNALVSGDLSHTLSRDHLPLAFTPNHGQAYEEVRFQARSFAGTLQFFPHRVVWSLPSEWQGETSTSTSLQLQFLGTQAAPEISSGNQLPGTVNYLIGDNPANWLRNIPTYEDIIYEGLYPGIDLHYSGEQAVDGGWSLKGTYTVAPGADPSQIHWHYQGASSIELDEATGNLVIAISGGKDHALVEGAPESWQYIDGKRIPVESHYIHDENNSIRIGLGTYDPAYPLIIDPTLIFSTYMGTSTEDSVNGIAVDDKGNIYVIGWTDSVDFPTTPDAFQPTSTGGTCYSPPPFYIPFPCNDGFVTKLSPDGSTLLYSTYLGGTQDDGIRAVALDSDNNIYLTGWTTSIDFPTMNPIQPVKGGGNNLITDAFVARLAADGSALQYSTYLGGSDTDYGDNLAVDDQGNAYIVGTTKSTDFPTVNPVQATYGGGFYDGIFAKVNAAGNAFDYSSYLGGNNLEYGYGIDVDSNGSAYISGFTLSNDFPTFNAMQPTFGGGIEAYVTKLTPDGNAFAYSTYFGSDDTRGYDIRVNDSGYAYLVGVTNSTDFPTVNPLQANYSGSPWDGFVSRFIPDGSALDFSTYLGGNGHDVIHTLTLDKAENVHFIGWSSSTDFPLSDPIQATPGGYVDLILGVITADLNTLGFSTYFGGSQGDYGFSIAADESGNTHIAGRTTSTDFPTLNPLQPDNAGGTEGFIARIDLDISTIPVASFLSSSPDALGETTVFTNTSTGINLEYQWDFGDGSPVVTTTNPTHIYPDLGLYTVTLTATNPVSSSVATGTVEIMLAPQAGFNTSSPDALGETTLFTNTSTGSNLAYQWDFGDGSPIVTATNPVHLYPEIGQYTVSLTATNPVNVSVVTDTVEILLAPQANFLSSSPDALGETTVFTNNSTGSQLAYQWDFGDNSPVVTTTNPVHIYTDVGLYTVTLTATNSVGSSAVAGTVEILLGPLASFLSSSPDALGETTVFTNTSVGSDLTFQWDFGDNSPVVTTTNPVHIYPDVGLYTVMLTATNSVGSSAFTGTVEILPALQASFLSSSPDALGETTVFTNTSTGSDLAFQWDFGDNSPVVTTTNPVHIYHDAGLYTVTLTATNSIGSSVVTNTVEIIDSAFRLFLPVIIQDY
jgi:PKD repeat protein